jgi:hypothetical protein
VVESQWERKSERSYQSECGAIGRLGAHDIHTLTMLRLDRGILGAMTD